MRRSLLVLALCALPAVTLAGFRASSHRADRAGGYGAALAVDGDPTTAWQVNPDAENEGAWFEIDVPKSTVDKLAAVVGWDKDEESFLDHPRIKTLKVEVFDDARDGAVALEHSVTFADARGWQILDLPDTEIGNELFGGRVRLTVKEVYPGTDFPNLAVSELLVHLGEFDARATLKTPPATSASGHSGGLLIDGDDRTYWASQGEGVGQSFELEAGGYGISSIGIQSGPKNHARPKAIEIFANEVTRRYEVADASGVQWFPIPAIVGYTGSGFGSVTVKVLETYPGTNAGVAISEVKLKATSYDGL